MKRSNRSAGLIIATLTTLTLATFGYVTFAAAGDESSNATATKAAVTHAAPPPPEKQTAIANSPLTLVIEAPAGGTFRLIRVPDEGWRFADRAVGTKPTEAALTATAMPQAEEDATVDQPLTVFIDGPTGYTYVWMRDEGWKFVGRVSDQKR